MTLSSMTPLAWSHTSTPTPLPWCTSLCSTYPQESAPCITTQWPVSEEIRHSSTISSAPPLMSTAPDIAPPSPWARCSMPIRAMRQAMRLAASMVGPSVPMRTQLPCGPRPTISTGLSSTRRSRYVPGSTSTTSNGLARARAALIVAWLPGSRPCGSTMCVTYVGCGAIGADDIIFSAKRRSFCVCPLRRICGRGVCEQVMSCRQPCDHESRRASSCFQLAGSRSALHRRCRRKAARQICSSIAPLRAHAHASSRQSSCGPIGICCSTVVSRSVGSASKLKPTTGQTSMSSVAQSSGVAGVKVGVARLY
mmetsp:Transcript_27363/g.69616  ORF Transcript_27363/g.69616 Transcript_27363/m.69616 type:complete len:309 (-) Transcript_27363:40-966(-)